MPPQLGPTLNIGLCVVATGEYTRFVDAMWDSASQHFLPQHAVQLFLFSDQPMRLAPGCELFPTMHLPWPGPTLYRYHFLLAHRERLQKMDYLYLLDADMRFVDTVGAEILEDLVAVHHPCSYAEPRAGCPYFAGKASFTGNVLGRSANHRGCDCGHHYYAGAFQGGRAERYLEAMTTLRARVDEDDRRGVVAEWHDETHWNRYLAEFPPDVALSPAYCFPEWQPIAFEPKILALSKPEKDRRP